MTKTKIKKLRLLLGITQEALADKIGVSVRTIQRWESGVKKPSKAQSVALEILKGR